MADWRIIIGNRNYSSWSLRGWLALAVTGAAFEEVVIPLDRPDTPEALRRWSPSLRVPVLQHNIAPNPLTIWDSLAIGEYLAEVFPQAKLWPEEGRARAEARCIVAEMHSGYAALRKALPMDMRSRRKPPPLRPEVESDIARIAQLWQDRLDRGHERSGPFLFGSFTLADVFHAPLVSRFVTYGIELPDEVKPYCRAIQDHPAYRQWYEAAKVEEWVIDEP